MARSELPLFLLLAAALLLGACATPYTSATGPETARLVVVNEGPAVMFTLKASETSCEGTANGNVVGIVGKPKIGSTVKQRDVAIPAGKTHLVALWWEGTTTGMLNKCGVRADFEALAGQTYEAEFFHEQLDRLRWLGPPSGKTNCFLEIRKGAERIALTKNEGSNLPCDG